MSKVSNKAREGVRELYIQGYPVEEVARITRLTVKTVNNYKSIDKRDGIDWERLRLKKAAHNPLNGKENVFRVFATYFRAAIESISIDNDLTDYQKVRKIGILSRDAKAVLELRELVNSYKGGESCNEQDDYGFKK
ncbi:MAG: DUF1804 family protein [Sulfurospirillaceae bacterium]|nr:DUF1804 family protein [Sulfurospirillaceae bacterium]